MMLKLVSFLAFVAASASASGLAVSPLVAAPIVTARSSQSIARNYNTLAAAPLAYTAPVAAAPLAYTAPVAAAAPLAYAAAPAFAAASPLAYAAPAAFAGAPLAYRAAPGFAPYAAAPLIFKK